MVGKYYTETQKRAQATYYKKLKSLGIKRYHGNPERNRYLAYVACTISLIRHLYKDAPY